MSKFKVRITETYVKTIEVEADNQDEALRFAENWTIDNEEAVVETHDEFHAGYQIVKEDAHG